MPRTRQLAAIMFTDIEGYTALMAAARSYQVEAVEFLVKNGANVNAQSNDGLTVLHHAVGETPYAPKRQSECLQILLTNNAIIDAQANSNATPLMWAAWFGCKESVNVLLENGASTKLTDNQNRTAEDMARQKDFIDLAKLIASY